MGWVRNLHVACPAVSARRGADLLKREKAVGELLKSDVAG